MALGTITVTQRALAMASSPIFMDVLSFPGDGAYASGGTLFSALVQAKLGDAREVLAVVDIGCPAGYYPVYDKAADKLKIYVRTTGVENATADISAQVFKVLVISK